MKKLFIALLVILIAALGGYSFYWNQKAEEVKTTVIDSIAKANSWAKVYTGNDQSLKYESAQTSGWPFHVNVTLRNPVLTIPVHTIAKTLDEVEKQNNSGSVAKKEPKLNVAKDVTWVETYSGDALVISSNLFATNISLGYEGEQKSVSTFNGVDSNPILYRAAIPQTCTLSVTRDTSAFTLFDVRSVFKDSTNFANRLREVSCESRGINSSDAKTNEVISTTESAYASFLMDITNKAQTTGGLTIKILNNKATKAQDKIFANYLSMFYRLFLNEEADLSILGIPMSELGNNTFELNISFNGPTDPALFMAKDMALNASINTFSVQNDLMKIDFETHFKSNPAQDLQQRDTAFVVRSAGKYTPRFDELKLKEIQAMAEKLFKDATNKEANALGESEFKNLKIEELRQAVDELWPRFAPYGNITFALDVAAKTDNPPMSPTGEFVLNNLDFITSLDGIKISGKGEQKGFIPNGELKITCLACEGLLDRTYAYIKLIDKWMAKVDETHVATISDALFQGTKKFLKDISVPAKDAAGKEIANDWLYHIKSTGEAEPTLNDKPIMKVMESFGQNVAPNMPNAQGEAIEGVEGAPESKFEPEGTLPKGEEEKPTN